MTTETSSRPAADRDRRWSARDMGWPRPRWIALSAALLLAIVLPFVVPDRSWLSVAILGAVWLTLNQSWNLVLGFSGVWHFGQLAIYAIGAYVAALLSLHTGLPAVLSIMLGGIVSMAVSVVLSLPALRLRGIYVALMTFGFGEVVRLLIVADGSGLTGGTYGLSGFEGFGSDSLDALTRDRVYYWIAIGVAIATGLVVFAIMRSPLGSGLIALRDNPTLAAARGISPRVLQMVAFGVSGFFAGVAGALYAFAFSVVSPTLMGLAPMTLLVTMLVVGGLGTVMGPIVGTVIMAFVQARLQTWPDARLIVLGLILLVMIVAVPRGIVPFVTRYRRRLDDWIEADDYYDDDEAASGEVGAR
ncbi:branched-chain amino acid ABC transporter permease [Mycolicibacterium sediminis]|uniref:Branched-chain amino acid ABC transporter permease n=1 Tax=Mycolicibacterium sediminis TaxID=1286180 RepID=A0A7I7QQ79_9MYCO|nr:branched-chain amino acid ABC transporter permease [Mycolicibacterium sediminis]BBY28481.1 branched-chain amino acid ABC transporter permease [Mycolicibacterium sediminis]